MKESISNQFYSYLHLLTFRRLCEFAYFFLLRVLINSTICIASVRPLTILEFRVSTSWPWLPSVSLLAGPKYSNFHPCRLTGQINWHALDIGLSITPLCLQIHFCINSNYASWKSMKEILQTKFTMKNKYQKDVLTRLASLMLKAK
jgi:hypothetical protein